MFFFGRRKVKTTKVKHTPQKTTTTTTTVQKLHVIQFFIRLNLQFMFDLTMNVKAAAQNANKPIYEFKSNELNNQQYYFKPEKQEAKNKY